MLTFLKVSQEEPESDEHTKKVVFSLENPPSATTVRFVYAHKHFLQL